MASFTAVDIAELPSRLDRVINETGFSGVVRVSHGGQVLYERADGLADRAHGVPNTLDTQFAVASGTKSFTAVAVMSLVVKGALALDGKAQRFLGEASELVDATVTVRQLLAHTSGLGDYLDENGIDDVEDYVLDLPVHRLTSPSEFVPLLRGRPAKSSPGTEFSYCNSGYLLLALVIEAVSGRNYYDMIYERVFVPAGMHMAAFLRLDDLPGSAAIGYLPKRDWRTNHFHLPVRGAGDGGAYATVGDIDEFWSALFEGRIIPPEAVAEMIRPQHSLGSGPRSYGLGFWLASGRKAVHLEGHDPGISFRSAFEPTTSLLYSVLSNTTSGAWPVVKELEAILRPAASGDPSVSP